MITVAEDRGCVFVPDADLRRVLPFDVDAGYREVDALTDVFDGAVRPLVDAVVGFATGAAVCVVTGEDSAGKSLTLEGRPSVSLPGAPRRRRRRWCCRCGCRGCRGAARAPVRQRRRAQG